MCVYYAQYVDSRRNPQVASFWDKKNKVEMHVGRKKGFDLSSIFDETADSQKTLRAEGLVFSCGGERERQRPYLW